MKEYFSKKFGRAKMNFQNFRSKVAVSLRNLGKRLDQNYSKVIVRLHNVTKILDQGYSKNEKKK